MIHVVTCHFNPHGYFRPVENYWRFRAALSPSVTLHTIELSFDGRFAIPDAMHIVGGPRNIMWQKERLLNLLVETLPAEATKIAWVDADVLFGNPQWFTEAEDELEKRPVAQLFETAHFFDQHGRIIRTRKSYVSVIRGETSEISCPGFAWAARREVFPLYDKAVCGGADKLMSDGWRGHYSQAGAKMNKAWCHTWMDHCDKQREIVQERIGQVRGDVIHLWHGSMENRNYMNRWKFLTDYLFDPKVDISLGDSGLWEWSSNKPEMHESIKNYFAERHEDG